MSGEPEVAEEVRFLDKEFSDSLKRLGFHPGCPVYEVGTEEFNQETLQAALFESTYSNPVLLQFSIEEHYPGATGGMTDEWNLPMLVESVRAVYTPRAIGVSETPIGCWERPEWFVTGFLYKSPFDDAPDNVRMNVLIHRDERRLTEAYLQVVRNPSNDHPDTPLRWGRGAPGQPD